MAETNFDDQRAKTQAYVQEHHIRELFSYLVQAVSYHRPENPRQFLRDEIKKMRVSGIQSLFTDEDITTMFEMIDVTKQNSISVDQLRNTCRNLAADGANGGGVDEAAIAAAADAKGRVGQEAFRKVIGGQLATKTFWTHK